MNFLQLKTFIEKQMRLQHVYQPVMLMTLLAHGGKASVRAIATNIRDHDDLRYEEMPIEHYEERTENMVGPVLQNHQVVKQEGREFELLVGELTKEQVALLIGLCQSRLDDFKQRATQRDG